MAKTHRGTAGVRSSAALIATLALLIVPAAAHAAHLPAVSSGPARHVSYGSASLNGTVNPNASNTSYYFQYGPTKAYGG
jgi:hypothetical protein